MVEAKKVLVVGGGSAGWSAAAYLNAALNRGGRQRADIMLIESPDVPRIGVGEATIPSINHVLAVIGLDETEFLRRVDGTFKQSIRYVNWVDGRGDVYHHPFSRYRVAPLDTTGHNWLASDRSIPFMDTVSAQPVICEFGLAPKMLGPWDFGPQLVYAYHMNALKFADYLTEHATANGVTHYLDNVVSVDQHENGHIAAVQTASGERIEADLFIDCTGFAALLIEKSLGVDFVDCSQWLLNDQAITMHVPYDVHYAGRVNPYTQATALSAGWCWDIPLQDRRSLGYVHSSRFIDAAAAEAELRRFEGPHTEGLDARVVPFKVGVRRQPWTANCVSIGLAGSFIEPLESTGLYLSHLAAVMLAEHFPMGDDYAPLAYRFNRIMLNRFYEILDFINMHFCLTRRTDTEYWREIGKPERITDRLRAKLDYWRVKPPSTTDFEDQFFPGQPGEAPFSSPGADNRAPIDTAGLWNYESYEAILYGMDYFRDECDQWFGPNRPRPGLLRQVAERLAVVRKKLPPHDLWLQRFAGMKAYPSAAAVRGGRQ